LGSLVIQSYQDSLLSRQQPKDDPDESWKAGNEEKHGHRGSHEGNQVVSDLADSRLGQVGGDEQGSPHGRSAQAMARLAVTTTLK